MHLSQSFNTFNIIYIYIYNYLILSAYHLHILDPVQVSSWIREEPCSLWSIAVTIVQAFKLHGQPFHIRFTSNMEWYRGQHVVLLPRLSRRLHCASKWRWSSLLLCTNYCYQGGSFLFFEFSFSQISCGNPISENRATSPPCRNPSKMLHASVRIVTPYFPPEYSPKTQYVLGTGFRSRLLRGHWAPDPPSCGANQNPSLEVGKSSASVLKY